MHAQLLRLFVTPLSQMEETVELLHPALAFAAAPQCTMIEVSKAVHVLQRRMQ